jgi:hypothetical protein
MPIHDWTRVKAGTYHNFRYLWVAAIMDRLNAGLLPPAYFAMAEQIVGPPAPDAVHKPIWDDLTHFVLPIPKDQERYARKTNQVVIHHELGEVLAVIEIVSPGNKDREHSFWTFVEKAVDLLRQQVNLLIVDPFPPGQHDPQGVHKSIWDEFTDQPFELPADKRLTLASYQVAPIRTAYVEPIAVGDRLPDMPLFLWEEMYVNVPLEETYQATWNVLPVQLRELVEPPAPLPS